METKARSDYDVIEGNEAIICWRHRSADCYGWKLSITDKYPELSLNWAALRWIYFFISLTSSKWLTLISYSVPHMTLSTWISLQFTGHVINEPRNGLFLWLTGRLRKPPLKWHRRLKNSHNTTVQLQTLIGSRDNRIRYLVKFNNLKQCMCTRFATAFNCACHTISVVFFTILVSMSLLRSKRPK